MRKYMNFSGFFAFLGIISATCAGGVALAVDAPQYMNQIEAYNPATSSYSELEKASALVGAHSVGLGYGGFRMTANIPGAASPVRLKAGTPVEFVTKMLSADIDPSSMIQFYMVDKKSDKRQILGLKMGSMFSGTSNGATKAAVAYDVATWKSAYWKVTPKAPLTPGEYCLTVAAQTATGPSTAATFYCFGVDA